MALKNVGRRFGGYIALEDVTIEVPPGSFVSVVGPSGCGKSTVLNLVAGLASPTSGSVELFGKPLEGLNRHCAYMFQQDGLLPWKTVIENVQLGLLLRKWRKSDAAESARIWIERVGLKGFENHYPRQLSGGMRKRVAMAQCWIVQPDVVLMDEPFSALDVHSRLRLESELLELWMESRQTVIFVTHDLEEAIALSDEVFLFSAAPGSRVAGHYQIELPRPRNLIDIKAEPRFHSIFRDIWGDLRQEVLKSYERSK